MTDLLRYALVGLGLGGVYAMLGVGMVMIYRGSGVVNFAHSGFALVGAYTVYTLRTENDLSTPVALVLAVLLGAVLGLAMQLLVLRPLRRASPLARVIATLGVLTLIMEGVLRTHGAGQLMSPPFVPTDPIKFADGFQVGQYAFWMAGIAVLLSAVATVTMARTRFGHAISASAENPRAAAALGWSPDTLAAATWALGGGLAALAGSLVPAISFGFISPTQFAPLIIGALAAALLAEFKSYPMACLGGIAVGVLQTVSMHFIDSPGIADSVPFAVIIVLMVVNGRGLPLRGNAADRLPKVGTGRVRWQVVVPLVVVLAVLFAVASASWQVALVMSTTAAIVGLSVVLLTGYAGQLSLAQFAMAGAGAFVAGRLSALAEWPFELALLSGVLAAGLIGFLLGLPALRTRGINLAVVTYGLGFAVHSVFFNNPKWGTIAPSDVSLLGIDLHPIRHPERYALLCLAALVLMCLIVANVRRGRVGRRMLAVRTNERAASAIGVDVFETKLYAFTLAAAIAGLGGVLLGFSYGTISFGVLYDVGDSILILVLTVIGGVGFVLGPVVMAVGADGGVVHLLLPSHTQEGLSADGGFSQWIPVIMALVLLATLLANQHGVAEEIDHKIGGRLRDRARSRRAAPTEPTGSPAAAGSPVVVRPRALEVAGLTQRFGGFTALEDVDLRVGPGEVVGLLGPNGAGKTTLIDCVSGYNRLTAGQVLLDGVDITRWSPHRRARTGLARSFQSLELFDDLTVRENLLAAADPRDRRAYLTDLVRPGRPVLPDVVGTAIEELNLADVIDEVAEDLSYGARRLVAIARAVATQPSVLLLDEPAAGLGEAERAELGTLVRRLADEWGMGVLLIEHDVELVLGCADRVVVLDFGQTIAEGVPAEIRQDAAVRRAYLGEESDVAPEASAR